MAQVLAKARKAALYKQKGLEEAKKRMASALPPPSPSHSPPLPSASSSTATSTTTTANIPQGLNYTPSISSTTPMPTAVPSSNNPNLPPPPPLNNHKNNHNLPRSRPASRSVLTSSPNRAELGRLSNRHHRLRARVIMRDEAWFRDASFKRTRVGPASLASSSLTGWSMANHDSDPNCYK